MRIFTIVFLMIYVIIIFHDSIPHVHGEENSAITTHQKEREQGHSHHSGHHHHTDSSDEPSFLSLLIGALSDHHNTLEIDHFDDDISLKTNSSNNYEAATIKGVVNYQTYRFNDNIDLCSNQEKNVFKSPPLLYEHSKFCTATLRGPPQFS